MPARYRDGICVFSPAGLFLSVPSLLPPCQPMSCKTRNWFCHVSFQHFLQLACDFSVLKRSKVLMCHLRLKPPVPHAWGHFPLSSDPEVWSVRCENSCWPPLSDSSDLESNCLSQKSLFWGKTFILCTHAHSNTLPVCWLGAGMYSQQALSLTKLWDYVGCRRVLIQSVHRPQSVCMTMIVSKKHVP